MTESEKQNLPDLEAVMLGWAREAGEIARRHYRRTGDLQFKKGRQAVTEADLEIEKMLRRRISEEFPEDGIVGEELGSDFQGTGMVGASGRTWHLDPVDGTLNFALGLPGFWVLGRFLTMSWPARLAWSLAAGILLASAIAGFGGFFWLMFSTRESASNDY